MFPSVLSVLKWDLNAVIFALALNTAAPIPPTAIDDFSNTPKRTIPAFPNKNVMAVTAKITAWNLPKISRKGFITSRIPVRLSRIAASVSIKRLIATESESIAKNLATETTNLANAGLAPTPSAKSLRSGSTAPRKIRKKSLSSGRSAVSRRMRSSWPIVLNAIVAVSVVVLSH